MFEKLAKIGVLVGTIIALAMIAVMVSSVEPYEKGKIAADAIILFGALFLAFESVAYLHRGMPANKLPAEGNFVLASSPARVDANEKGEELIGGRMSLLVNLSRIKNGKTGRIKGYIVELEDLKPGDNLTAWDLFNRLLRAKKGDQLHIYRPSGKMYFKAM